LADNWPREYYGHIFMLNFHGRRINQDLPERRGSGYVARHGADLVKFGDPWFQGIDLAYGPDGGVTVLDWSDTGECHGANGVHRETGRIYKLTCDAANTVKPGESPAPLSLLTNGLANFSNAELLHLQLHPNEWYARHARRILQERAPSIPASFRDETLSLYLAQTNIPLKLRLLFTLHALGADTTDWLKAQLKDRDEHIRSWAVRYLGEALEVNWEDLVPLFVTMAKTDSSPVVRLYLASALQRMPKTLRAPLAAALLQHAEDASDHNLPLMLWYGIEPIVAPYPDTAIHLAMQSRIPLLRQCVSRRLGEEISKDPATINNLLAAAATAGEAAQCDILHGLADVLQGRHAIPKPASWDALRAMLEKSVDKNAVAFARQVGAVFGDPWAIHQLEQIALDPAPPADDRRAALRQVIDARPANLNHVLQQALNDQALSGLAAHGLLLLGDPNIAAWALQRWNSLDPGDRAVLVGMMVSRPASAKLLLDAVGRDVVPRSALNAFHARQIGNFHDFSLSQMLVQVWGEVHSSDADKLQLIARYRSLLTPERLKQADLSRGREVFSRTCAVCHRLYGEGAAIGPDLTGSGRANLGYLLENIADPSAIVPADYRVSEIELKDGRDLTALVVAKTDHSLTLQTPTEKFTIERSEVTSLRQTKISLMPEGLLQGLKDTEVCNLIAYLMAPTQVPLPPLARK
jgi:putative heme-binding domain-containing protein